MNEIHSYLFPRNAYKRHGVCAYMMCHCASIAPFLDGVLVVFYTGHSECDDSQRVELWYWDKTLYHRVLSLVEKTGNPVIWATGRISATILWSYFEKKTDRKINRWRHCSNWLADIITETPEGTGIIRASSIRQLETDPLIGCLGRCAPIKVENKWLLPMYTEQNPHGIIMSSSNCQDWEVQGRIGKSDYDAGTRFGRGILMQPTLWHDGKKLHSLSRNVARTEVAFYSASDDLGKSWSKPVETNIPNHNNSLVAVQGVDPPLIIWNTDRGRQELMLGRITFEGGRIGANPIKKLNDMNYGAYPNYCFDNDGRLHVVLTDKMHIRHRIFEL